MRQVKITTTKIPGSSGACMAFYNHYVLNHSVHHSPSHNPGYSSTHYPGYNPSIYQPIPNIQQQIPTYYPNWGPQITSYSPYY